MKKYILTIIFICSLSFVFSQNKPLMDSLKIVIKSGKDNPEKVSNILLLGDEYSINDADSASIIYTEGLVIARKINDKKSIADCLEYLGILNNSTFQKYDVAEKYFLECESIRKEIYGNKDGLYGDALYNLAILYQFTAKYSTAEKYFLQAKDVYFINYNSNQSSYINCMIGLANFYIETGKLLNAEQIYLEVKPKFIELFSNKSSQYAFFLNGLAGVYRQLGNYKQSEDLYQECLGIRKAVLGEENPDYALTLNNIAVLYVNQGRYSEAEPLYLKGKEIFKTTSGDKSRGYSTFLNNLAYFYLDLSYYSKAEPLFIETIKILKSILGEIHPDYADAIKNLANLYKSTGEFEKAEPLYLKAISILKLIDGGNNYSYTLALNEISSFYNLLGDYKKAEVTSSESCETTKKLFGENHLNYSVTLSDLALIDMNLKNYEKSEQLLLQAKEIHLKNHNEKHPNYAILLNNLGLLYYYTNKLDKAESLFLEALSIIKESLGENESNFATTMSNLALVYKKTKRFEKAEKILLEVLKKRKESMGESHPDYIQSLNELAVFYQQTSNIEKAQEYFYKNINKRQKQIQKYFSFLSESEKEKFLNSISPNFDNFYGFALKSYKSNPQIASDLYNCFVANKGMILNSNLKLKNSILQSNDTSLINLYNNWLIQKNIFGKFQQSSIENLNKQYINLDSIENITNSLEKSLISKSVLFAEKEKLNSQDWISIQKNLKKDESAIEFIKFNKTFPDTPDSILYCALLIRPGYSNPKLVYLFEEKQLEEILNRMASNRGVQILEQPATKEKSVELYDLIWKPFDSLLKGTKTVFYSPIGLLYRVPFAAMSPPDKKYLFDKYNLKVVSCTRNIQSGNKSLMITPDFSTTIYGGIQFNLDANKQIIAAKKYSNSNLKPLIAFSTTSEIKNATRGGSWNYLKGTLIESNAILSEFNKYKINAELISGENAVEESFKSISGKSPKIIHIATHGFYFADNKQDENKTSNNPLNRSGLIMAGANRVWTGEKSLDGIDDGILTAYEVSLLDLSSTKLVVLSACETGLGDIKGSEGVYGLQRAFKMAGVDYQIITLWEIRDEVTVEFMSIFYQQWLKGKDIHAAFKFAQDEMRKKYEANYWAAFVLMD